MLTINVAMARGGDIKKGGFDQVSAEGGKLGD